MNRLPVVNERIEERRILPEMTVREINARYPACRAVFARHGMGGCGGELGPDEPLEFFAAAHRFPLLDDLRARPGVPLELASAGRRW